MLSKYVTELMPNGWYHIFNHANGKDNLFLQDSDYQRFLNKYTQYIHPIVETHAFCLLPNHFHILVSVKSEMELSKYFKLSEPSTCQVRLSKQFSNFFNSYSKYLNNKYNRKGSLFCRQFKRKEIGNEQYYNKMIHYIHNNPVHHGFCNSIFDWEYSSIHSLTSIIPTIINREKVINWYGNKDLFINAQITDSISVNEMEFDFY